ncbi:L,D-transpeptidase family protein [Rubrivirga sp.]|uniref:L,D-transpeptidase family protein n=1 Tax=Rubrivirga sp. TaxID=1885344 RepID=UPI003C77B482
MRVTLALAFAVSITACQMDGAEPDASASKTSADVVSTVSAPDTVSTVGDDRVPSDEEAEANRYRGRGRDLIGADTTGQADAQRANTETLADLDSTRDWSSRLQLPLGGDVEGPSVAKLQVLLDRAGFSPGQIDGRWGDNTELALVWFQRSANLEATTVANEATVRALAERAGQPSELVTTHVLTEDDVAGPFVEIPDDVYEKAELDRLGFESLSEKLGERFHAAPSFLAQLNGGVALDSLAAGDTLRVPNVAGAPGLEGEVSRLVISGEAGYLHALAANGDVLFHAPVTVGSSYDPSPQGSFEVESVTRDPWWHYQPSILEGVPDDEEEAHLPPGPNNAVGLVWMALSKEHYGIHGTRAPGTIGYASSAGCVRLTNWDVLRLAGMVEGGTPVRFRDMSSRS